MKKLFILSSLLLTLAAGAQQQPKTKCQATTKAGTPCKMTPKQGQKFCFIHSETSQRCGAMTTKQTPCKQIVKQAGQKCRFHS